MVDSSCATCSPSELATTIRLVPRSSVGLAPEQLFEGRDLEVTTDFRQLFTEVAWHHLGVPNQANVFPGFAPSPETLPGVLT